MNIDSFKALIDSYGTNLETWPADRREAALELLAESEQAQQVIESERALDDKLALSTVDINLAALESRILAATLNRSKSRIDRLISWLLPDPDRPVTLWRPALAAALPLAFGLYLGSAISLQSSADSLTDEEMLALMGLTASDAIEMELMP